MLSTLRAAMSPQRGRRTDHDMTRFALRRLAAVLIVGLAAILLAGGAFAESTRLPQPGEKPGASAPNRFYMYGVIGRVAMLAASYELEATDPEAETYD